MARKIFLFGFLAALAAVSGWLADAFAPKQQAMQRRADHSPDSFSTGLTKTVMNEKGEPEHKLVADAMRHYSDDDTIELEGPVLTIFREEGPPWIIKSEAGLVMPDGEEVILNGKVHINREAGEGVREMNIFTTDLKIKPKIEYAETDNYVEMIAPLDRLSGTGMRLMYAKPIQLTLLSKVRVKYESR